MNMLTLPIKNQRKLSCFYGQGHCLIHNLLLHWITFVEHLWFFWNCANVHETINLYNNPLVSFEAYA